MTLFWVIFLSLAGMVLIVAEFIVPGGIVGGIGALLMVGSGIAGVYYLPEYAGWIIGFDVVGFVLALLGGIFIISKTRLGRGLTLADGMSAEKGWVSDETREEYLGQTGTVFSPLRPAGFVVVGNERINAVSNGEFIEKGATVQVIEVHGNRIVVERATAPEADTAPDEAPASE